jgi:hypothetical protein
LFIYVSKAISVDRLGEFCFANDSALMMIVIANGFTTIAEQTLPSGLTSILVLYHHWLFIFQVRE